MQIQVTGKHMDVGDALRTHVAEKLDAAVEKYADRVTNVAVTFSRAANNAFKADATVKLPSGLKAQASATAHDVYAAFDGCAERIEKQLRRYKRRLKDHHAERTDPIEAMEAQAYVLAAAEHHDEEPATLDPVIVAEMMMEIQKISVGEAVMQMELAHAPLLVFRNERHGEINVVFRRDDGNIGWVDPANLAAARG